VLSLLGHARLRAVHFPLLACAGFLALAGRWVVLGYLRRVAIAALRGEDDGLPAWDRFEEDFTEGLKLWLVALGLVLPAIGITVSFAFLFQAVGLGGIAWMPVVVLLPPLLLATFLYMPAALLAAVSSAEVTAAFDVPRVSAVVNRVAGPYLLAFVLALATEIIAQFGLLLVCAGIFATRFLAHCMVAHAFASVWRAGSELPAGSGSLGARGDEALVKG